MNLFKLISSLPRIYKMQQYFLLKKTVNADPSNSGDHDMEQKCPPKCEQYDFDIDRIMVSLD